MDGFFGSNSRKAGPIWTKVGALAGNDSWLPREKFAINRHSGCAIGGGYETGDQRHRMAGLRQQSAEPRHLHHLQRRLPLRFPQDPLRQIPLQSATTELGRRAVRQGNARTHRNRPLGLLHADRVLLQRLIRARSTKCARCSQGRIWGVTRVSSHPLARQPISCYYYACD